MDVLPSHEVDGRQKGTGYPSLFVIEHNPTTSRILIKDLFNIGGHFAVGDKTCAPRLLIG